MSLMTRQLLLQAQSDRDDILHRFGVGEDSPKLRGLLVGAEKRINKLQKQMDAETKKQTPAAMKKISEAPAKPHRPLLEDLSINCCDCSFPFSFTGKEQVFYKKNGWELPVRCVDCRKEKKNSRPPGKNLTCGECEKGFFFSEAKEKEFEERNWPQPKFCFDCRAARKAEYAKKKTAESVEA